MFNRLPIWYFVFFTFCPNMILFMGFVAFWNLVSTQFVGQPQKIWQLQNEKDLDCLTPYFLDFATHALYNMCILHHMHFETHAVTTRALCNMCTCNKRKKKPEHNCTVDSVNIWLREIIKLWWTNFIHNWHFIDSQDIYVPNLQQSFIWQRLY